MLRQVGAKPAKWPEADFIVGHPGAPAEIARRFTRAPRNRMKDMLEALVAMGTEDGRHVA